MRLKEDAAGALELGKRAASLELGAPGVGADPVTDTDANMDEKNVSNYDGLSEIQSPTGCGAGNSFFWSLFRA